MRKPFFILLIMFLLLLAWNILLAIGLSVRPSYKTELANLKTSAFVNGQYIPSHRLFGLQSDWGTIESSYYNEQSLINGSFPVADSDLMLIPGSHDRVYLPGDKRDRYYFLGYNYVDGSGYYETWRAPNGGYFAFLHLVGMNVSTLFHPPIPKLDIVKVHDKIDDHTGYVVNKYHIRLLKSSLVGSGYYYGGRYVADSGWPTDPYYGNGTAGPNNAHLCVVYDALAQAYFRYVEYRHAPKPPKPQAFNFKLWYWWHIKHHKPNISPYYHHKLSFVATYWWKHKKEKECRSVIFKETWHPKGKSGFDGFELQQFQGCAIYFWPRHPKWHLKVTRERFVS